VLLRYMSTYDILNTLQGHKGRRMRDEVAVGSTQRWNRKCALYTLVSGMSSEVVPQKPDVSLTWACVHGTPADNKATHWTE